VALICLSLTDLPDIFYLNQPRFVATTTRSCAAWKGVASSHVLAKIEALLASFVVGCANFEL